MDSPQKPADEKTITENKAQDEAVSPPSVNVESLPQETVIQEVKEVIPPSKPLQQPFIDTPPKNLGSEFDIVQPAILPPLAALEKVPVLPPVITKKENPEALPIPKSILNKPKKANNIAVFIVFAVSLLLILILISVVFAVIAYGKINIGGAAGQKAIERFVLNLPFTPKTPEFILESTLLAHGKITSQSFDFSLAAKGDDPVSNLGLNQVDAGLKGKLDYSDQNNIRTSLSLQITKDFNAEIRKNDKLIYFKVNKLPKMLYTLLSMDEEKIQPILDNWINFDTTPLNTQARERLNEVSKESGSASEITTNSLNKFATDEVLKNIKITTEVLNSTEVYRLHFAPDDQALDTISQKVAEEAVKEAKKLDPKSPVKIEDYKNISKTLKNVVVDLYIGKKDYYLRKIGVNFDLIYDKNSGGFYDSLTPELSSKYTVSMVLTMDDFGKPIAVELPAKSISSDEAIKMIQQAIATNNQATDSALPENPELLNEQASGLKITSAKTVVSPASSSICPTAFAISGTINGTNTGTITYRWVRSDGIKTPYETTEMVKNKAVAVTGTPWIIGESFTGWVTLETITPNKITSPKASFSLTCKK